jgi:hypothetical protein
VNDWREAMFQLCWHQHGGSGAAIAYESVLTMTVRERNWWLKRVSEQRDAEAEALNQAARGR